MRNQVKASRQSLRGKEAFQPCEEQEDARSVANKERSPVFRSDARGHNQPAPGLLWERGVAPTGCSSRSVAAEPARATRPEKILLPIDLTQCPVEALELVGGMFKQGEVTVVLLHVVHLNIAAPENRIYEELASEAQRHLARLADQYLHPGIAKLLRVRAGNPAAEILAEAKFQRVDLIVLPARRPSFWTRLASLWKPAADLAISRLAGKIIREARCSVFMLAAKPGVHCEEARVGRTDDISLSLAAGT